MRLVPHLLAAALVCPTLVAAQKNTEPFDPARLARIDAWVKQLVADRQIPGAVVMLVRDGKVAYHKAFGVRDLERRVPLETSDLFRIASQTKAITSLAAMMLWEEGKFALDDPLSKYIPAFKDQTVLTKFNRADSSFEARPSRGGTTIRQLLTHTSGLDYADIGSEEFRAIYAKAGITAMGREGDVLGERVERLARLPLRSDPGERYTYSLSSDVLGRLVEVLSGMPLDRFFQTRIFEPLGLRDTHFAIPPAKRERLVSLHSMQRGTLTPSRERSASAPAGTVTYFAGGSGLSSTTADYARFLQLFLNGGELDGVRLLGRKTVELMLTNQLASLQRGFGLGFGLETPENDSRSPLTLGSFSWGGAFNTTYWADPKERLIGLIYTNTYGAPSLGEPFKVLVYSALR